MKLKDTARVIRSKNAGPLKVTVDLMFGDERAYQQAVDSPALNPQRIASLYQVSPAAVAVAPFPQALAIKIVMDRQVVAGTPGDRDVYGAQQHAQLLELEL